MKIRKAFLFVMIVMVTAILCSCNKKENLANDNKLNIITSFYPMYIATANIIDGAENVTLECLASPEVGCLHDYQLTVKDMMSLEHADVFVINGGGMEAFLDKAISAYPELAVINAGEEIIENEEHEHHEELEREHQENNSIEVNEHEEHNEENGHEHSHGEINPHIWVSIDFHIAQIEKIANELGKIDEENKLIYDRNAKEYINKLNDINSKMHFEIDKLPNKNIITFHEAFDYFAENFGLNVLEVIEREPGTNPSAKEIARIIDVVREHNVNAIFVEPQYLKTAANVIASETNVNVYELNPITSGSFDKNSYIRAMEKNLEVLKEALK